MMVLSKFVSRTWLHSYLQSPIIGSMYYDRSQIKRLLEAADRRLTPGQRQKLSWEGANVYITKEFPDGQIVYVAVILQDEEDEYPDRVAYAMMRELQQSVEESLHAGRFDQKLKQPGDDCLSTECQAMITALCKKYDDHEAYDKLARVAAKTKAVQAVMKENIGEMLKKTENLNVLDEQAMAMEAEAMDYDEQAEDIKEYFWWKDCKATALIALVVVICIGVGVACCIQKCGKSSSSASSSLLQVAGEVAARDADVGTSRSGTSPSAATAGFLDEIKAAVTELESGFLSKIVGEPPRDEDQTHSQETPRINTREQFLGAEELSEVTSDPTSIAETPPPLPETPSFVPGKPKAKDAAFVETSSHVDEEREALASPNSFLRAAPPGGGGVHVHDEERARAQVKVKTTSPRAVGSLSGAVPAQRNVLAFGRGISSDASLVL